MYKSYQTKDIYIAINTFGKNSKKVSKVYNTGIWKVDHYEMISYYFVIYRFRFIFGIKKKDIGSSY